VSNLGRKFLDLLPISRLYVALVVSINGDGTSTVQFANGSMLVVRGQSVAADNYAFIRDGEIRSQAPSVAPATIVLPVAPPNYVLSPLGVQLLSPSGVTLVWS
jgi:hypothetical protein